MRTMRFQKVCLISHREQAAFMMKFGRHKTVVSGSNGLGKSALLKSLYNSFGARPHKINDGRWSDAEVISAVQFEIGGVSRTVVKLGGTYAFFDAQEKLEFVTSSISTELAPYIADILDFRLMLTNANREVVTPPPAYAFAPYYVDQDGSWNEAWKPFVQMYLPRTTQPMAEYHSGLRTNAYYIAKAERDGLNLEKTDALKRADALNSALEELRAVGTEGAIYLDLAEYSAETEHLLVEVQKLHAEQSKKRSKLSELQEERSLWVAQAGIAEAALRESDVALASASGQQDVVICPTCGEHYVNDIAARFGIAADSAALIEALHRANGRAEQLAEQILSFKRDVEALNVALERVQAILSIKRSGFTLGEVMEAQGRNSAMDTLRRKIDALEANVWRLEAAIKSLEKEMRAVQSREKKEKILSHYRLQLTHLAGLLDVEVKPESSITMPNIARGSEGARAMATYYYAFLRTVRSFGSSTFCPIVIDAPNQQGQDITHLPAIVKCLTSQCPHDAQLILAVEDASLFDVGDAAVVSVGKSKNHLLDENMYEDADAYLRPLLLQLI